MFFKASLVIGGTFSGVTGSGACDTGTDSWDSARLKGTRIKDMSAT